MRIGWLRVAGSGGWELDAKRLVAGSLLLVTTRGTWDVGRLPLICDFWNASVGGHREFGVRMSRRVPAG